MDYYQGVVTEFLRADRATFINTEFCIQLSDDPNKFEKGRHWFCDAVAINFREETIYLCEVTFAQNPAALLNRLQAWATHWDEVPIAIRRYASLGAVLEAYTVRPWLFVPKIGRISLETKISKASLPFVPRITNLEETAPWKYRSWDRRDEIQSVEVEC